MRHTAVVVELTHLPLVRAANSGLALMSALVLAREQFTRPTRCVSKSETARDPDAVMQATLTRTTYLMRRVSVLQLQLSHLP